jgi:hypothetical protein
LQRVEKSLGLKKTLKLNNLEEIYIVIKSFRLRPFFEKNGVGKGVSQKPKALSLYAFFCQLVASNFFVHWGHVGPPGKVHWVPQGDSMS